MKLGLIITGQTPTDPVHWAIGDEERLRDGGTVTDLSKLPQAVTDAEQIVIILPGDRAATRRLHLPVKGERALADAAALAFEDILAEPVDSFHLAFGPADAEGVRTVSAVPHEDLQIWITATRAADVHPDIITLDHHCLYAEGYSGVLLRYNDHIAASLPPGGLSGDAAFVEALTSRMEETKSALHVVVGITAPGDIRSAGAALTLADERALGAFFMTGLSRPVPNFRRGPYAKRRDWRGLARSWRVAGGLMAACLTLWLLDVAADGFRHNRAADRLASEARAQFSRAYPDVVIRDLRRQAQQRLSASNASAFLPLSAELTQALQQTSRVQLTRLRFTPDNELVADLRFPTAADLEQLKSMLEGRGVRTREGGDYRRDDNGDYIGQLYLESV
ncbi:type II secretion system protein GspL [Parvularcula sp. LCG005]|uniref:type II secretion system protein GspL n=1 Tax=Parvularcula sp. LCG005 TaxID=3078805 RepID=UPI00294233C1|nr:type II secretion system protein GspL [Parvularcula sp. LCG005]WOI54375.1 type II secretion system protein GspL [Parvularcula sp. LCG005]